MDSKDRTFEYQIAIKSIKSRQLNYGDSKPNSNMRQANMFTHAAKDISKDLANTYAKLEKLTLLASNKSMFDDRSNEIQELSQIIKDDISSMNNQLMELQKYLKQNKSQYASKNKHVEKHSNSILFSLQSKLASISNDFKNILEIRSENLKQQKNRQNKIIECNNQSAKLNHNLHQNFSPSPSTAIIESDKEPLLPSKSVQKTAPIDSSSFLRFQKSLVNDYMSKQQQQHNKIHDYSTQNDTVAIPIPPPPSLQQAQLQQQGRDQTESYLESRVDAVQTIESTIVELGTIFTQLAHMVKEQDEIIQRIDANVEESHFSIEAAHTEILKYFQSLSSNRWLLIKIFGILVVFVIFFVLFFA